MRTGIRNLLFLAVAALLFAALGVEAQVSKNTSVSVSNGIQGYANDTAFSGTNGVMVGGLSGSNWYPLKIGGANGPSIVQLADQYPYGAVKLTGSNTGTTGVVSTSLPNSATGTTTYVCGFSARSNATVAATGSVQLNGIQSSDMWFTHWTAPLASGVGITEMIFTPCIPATGVNVPIILYSTAAGAGGTTTVAIWGYRL